MKLIRSLFDRRALLPAAALLILSGVYELGYYAIFALPLPAVGQERYSLSGIWLPGWLCTV